MRWYDSIAVQLSLLLGIVWAEEKIGKDESFNEAFIETATALDQAVFLHEDVPIRKRQFVQLTISARNFPISIDSMCIVLKNSDIVKTWIEHARTEIVETNGDPDFVKKIVFCYSFEDYIPPLLIKCYKIVMTSLQLRDEDLLGFASVTLWEVDQAGPMFRLELEPQSQDSSSSVLWWNYNKKRRLKETGEKDSGKPYIIMKIEKLKNYNTQNGNRISFVLRGSKVLVPLRNWSSSYFDIYQVEDSTATDYETLIMRIGVLGLVRGERLSIPSFEAGPDHKLKFVCRYRCERTQRRRIVGEFETSIMEIENDGRRTFELKDPSRKKGEINYRNSGVIRIIEYDGIYNSFLEYIKGGLEIHFSFGIDFTNSNADQLLENSSQDAYSLRKTLQNRFERALYALTTIIEEYDADKKFPILGLGASSLSHEEDEGRVFYVDPTHQFCRGIAGALDAYRRCLAGIKATKSAHFAPIIQHIVHKYVYGHDNGNEYFVLLILTNGRIEDMEDTKRVIKEATELPLSIIIVGIGNQDFQSMAELKAHSKLDRLDGTKVERDIVHFIALNQFIPTTKKRLTKELLAELPRQLVTYMANRHFKPESPCLNSAELPPHPGYL